MTYQTSNSRVRERLNAIADAIASVNIDQEAREAVADEVAAVVDGFPGINASVWRLRASDPLLPCAGALGKPCPHNRMMRIRMHLSSAPDGRSFAWRQRVPHGEIRCISCGAAEFIPGYADNSPAYAEV